MGDLGETLSDGMESFAKGLGELMGNPLVDAALIGFMVAGAIVDAVDPCNLKSEMDSNALNNIVENMNSVFQNSLSGNFTSTTLDGAQIIDEVWPIPYFADTYAQSFLDAYVIVHLRDHRVKYLVINLFVNLLDIVLYLGKTQYKENV